RARLLLQWGERLAPLAGNERTEDNRVSGCESQVWLVAERQGNGWQFRAASDARLIRGLLAVLLARVDGLGGDELQQVDLADWFAWWGLGGELSPSRSNGLHAVLRRMAELAAGWVARPARYHGISRAG